MASVNDVNNTESQWNAVAPIPCCKPVKPGQYSVLRVLLTLFGEMTYQWNNNNNNHYMSSIKTFPRVRLSTKFNKKLQAGRSFL